MTGQLLASAPAFSSGSTTVLPGRSTTQGQAFHLAGTTKFVADLLLPIVFDDRCSNSAQKG